MPNGKSPIGGPDQTEPSCGFPISVVPRWPRSARLARRSAGVNPGWTLPRGRSQRPGSPLLLCSHFCIKFRPVPPPSPFGEAPPPPSCYTGCIPSLLMALKPGRFRDQPLGEGRNFCFPPIDNTSPKYLTGGPGGPVDQLLDSIRPTFQA